VAVEHRSELTRGYSLFDDRAERNPPNARVIDEIDEAGFFEAYLELLRTPV
jgi:inosine-uridine nucleoside N-ribohydrolase